MFYGIKFFSFWENFEFKMGLPHEAKYYSGG